VATLKLGLPGARYGASGPWNGAEAIDAALRSHDEALVRDLARRCLGSPQLERFAAAAMERLTAELDAPVPRRYLLNLFAIREFALALFASKAAPLDPLVELCRQLMEDDRAFDVRLARLLPTRVSEPDDIAAPVEAQWRIMEVVDRISSGARVLMTVGHLAEHSNDALASKAAKLIGRRLRNRAWLEKHLASGDARVRANVIESLWGLPGALVHRVFLAALSDGHNRVVGNALIGLARVGEPDVASRVRLMLADPRPAFRATAAWVAGQLSDLTLINDLRVAVGDDMEAVRSAARRALEHLLEIERCAAVAEAAAVTERAGDQPAQGAPGESGTPAPDDGADRSRSATLAHQPAPQWGFTMIRR
jgi:hypothetical protein